jgi:hypothetical protein
MNKDSEAQKKRQNIQVYFWNIVGSVEHINVPKLEDAIRKEFNTKDARLVQAQVNLMQTEARIRIESNAKVWIKQPEAPCN